MKTLQTIKADELKHPDYTYIMNPFGLIIQVPNEQAEREIATGKWKVPSDEEIVIDYIKTHALDWKPQIYVPNYNNFSPLQGYTHFARKLEEGLNMYGVEFSANLRPDTDLILVINSVWANANDGQLAKLKEQAKERNIPLAMFTMFESDHWIDSHVAEMENLDFLIVPCTWNKEVLENQGYSKPIYVCPLPLEEGYDVKQRKNPDVFTFLTYNGCDIRKGFPEYLHAFFEEFGEDEPVKFIQKSRANDPANANFNPYMDYLNRKQFVWLREDMGTQQLVDLHARTHCFVFPSKGEGWGYTPLEALMCGNPVIVPNQHAFKDWFNEACLEIETELEPATFSIFGEVQEGTGNWFKPKVESIRKQMRFIYEEWKREGRGAKVFVEASTQREKLINKYNKKEVAKLMISILKKRKIIK